MRSLTRNALTVLLSIALSPAFAQAPVGSTSRGYPVRVLPDSAAGRVVATVYEGRFSWVRIETRESGAAPNQHPFNVAPATLRAMLERVQLADGKPEPLFSAKQLDEIAAPLANALGRASAEQDVSIAVSDQFGFMGPLAARAVTTARVFQRDGQLQVIAGLVRRDFESQFNATGMLIAFEPGQRAKPVERGTKLTVAGGSGAQVRDDWVALSTSVVAAAPAAAAPAAGGGSAASPATPATPAAAAPATKDADALYRTSAERLRALEKLRSDGLITEQEYQEKRRQILREL